MRNTASRLDAGKAPGTANHDLLPDAPVPFAATSDKQYFDAPQERKTRRNSLAQAEARRVFQWTAQSAHALR